MVRGISDVVDESQNLKQIIDKLVYTIDNLQKNCEHQISSLKSEFSELRKLTKEEIRQIKIDHAIFVQQQNKKWEKQDKINKEQKQFNKKQKQINEEQKQFNKKAEEHMEKEKRFREQYKGKQGLVNKFPLQNTLQKIDLYSFDFQQREIKYECQEKFENKQLQSELKDEEIEEFTDIHHVSFISQSSTSNQKLSQYHKN